MRRLLSLLALLGADGISAIGRTMTMVAIPWFVLASTGSGSQTGVVAAAESIGLLVSVAVTGPWTDRYGARRISVLSDLATAFAVAAIPVSLWTAGLPLGVLVALSFLIGAGRSPAHSAKKVLLPETIAVSGTRVERATSAQEGMMGVGNLLGAPLGGLLIALVEPPAVLLIDAATLVSSAVLIPAYGTRIWHSSTQVGIVVAAIGGGGLLGTILYGWVGHRFRRWSVTACGFLLFGGPTYLVLALDP